jgi:hypothetical protein
MKRTLKRFAQSIGRFVVLVHLGPRLGSSGARVIGSDPIEDWEQRQREAEEVDRKQAQELDELE